MLSARPGLNPRGTRASLTVRRKTPNFKRAPEIEPTHFPRGAEASLTTRLKINNFVICQCIFCHDSCGCLGSVPCKNLQDLAKEDFARSCNVFPKLCQNVAKPWERFARPCKIPCNTLQGLAKSCQDLARYLARP